MPAEVIDRVHIMARRSATAQGLTFLDRTGQPEEEDDADDDSYHPETDSDDEEDDDDDQLGYDDDIGDAHIAGVNPDNNQQVADEDENETEVDDTDDNTPNEHDQEEQEEQEHADDTAHDAPHQDPEVEEEENENEENENEDATVETVEATEQVEQDTMEDTHGERTAEHNLRPRRPRDYGHLRRPEEGTMMTQHSMKKGIKEFGEAGVNAVLDELKQLHDRNVIEPKSAQSMTREDR